jgi:erythromycin esterase
MMPRTVARLLIGTTLLLGSAANAQQWYGYGFEERDAAGRPSGWYAGGAGFEVALDSTERLEGRFSLRTRWADATPYSSDSRKFGVATRTFPVWQAAGRRIHLRGYIRTESIQTGYAGFWVRVDGPGNQMLAFDNMQTRGVRGSTAWTRYDIELPVDSGALAIVFGALHPGDGTAWFDSLTVEVVGEATPRRVAAVTKIARPDEVTIRLLTDAELALPADSVVVPEAADYTKWVRKNARPIRSLGANDFSDLRFFRPLLANKRIVQLGESGHGVAEFNMAKVRLIKYLHQELGYDVIAFESSLFECYLANSQASRLSGEMLMRGCIFGVWHSDETLALFEYIKQTQATSRPLILAGFDEQTSSQLAKGRPNVFGAAIAKIDSAYAKHVHVTDSMFLADRSPGYASANQARLVAFYDSVATFLRVNRPAIEAAMPDAGAGIGVAMQTAVSMTYFVRQLAAGAGREGTRIRDLGMANNLDFLLDEMYPGKKVIVWAHNFHIQHRENTDTASATANHTMGTWVARRHRPELYTIGLFMYRGQAAHNDRRIYPIAPSKSGSLESILHQAPWRYSFVDFSKPKRERGSEWIWKPITAMSWGTTVETIVPRDEYDGVLFIDRVHAPRYR